MLAPQANIKTKTTSSHPFAWRFLTLLLLLCVVSLFVGFEGWARTPKKSAASKDPDLRIHEEMQVISRQLGVTCTYCHDPANFRSASLKEFGIAKEHMRVVNYINSEKGWNQKPRIDCFTCHRGNAKIDLRAELDASLKSAKSNKKPETPATEKSGEGKPADASAEK